MNQVAHLDRTYFQTPKVVRQSLRPPTMGTPAGEGLASIVTEDNISDTELAYLIDDETLREWAPLSLPERSVRFHRHFPDRIIRPWTLSKIMRKAGIKKKVVQIHKAPQRKTERLEEFDRKLIKLAAEVSDVMLSGGHLVFADESIFNSRDF